jgi:hypothetical protein
MNYAYQLTGLPTTTTPVFDYSQYSSTEVPTLNEQNLNETLGFQVASPLGPLPSLQIGSRLSPLQRNLLGAWYCMNRGTRTGACRDADGNYTNGCNLNSAQKFSCGVAPQSSVTATIRLGATAGIYLPLVSYLDWAYLNFGGGSTGFGLNLAAPVSADASGTTHTDPHDPATELNIQPNPPTGVSARRTGNTVRVAWNPVGALNSFVYSVYKKVDTGFFQPLTDTKNATVNDTVAPGQTVQYYVTATSGASVTSANSALATVVVPGAPIDPPPGGANGLRVR